MANSEESVLKTALPPATDYLTYLTILEYNLDKEDIPLLHEILQDEKLVVNIGWDLVHLLLPLLPESDECLQDVAVRGNPREVILKVTEELDRLALPAGTGDDDSEEDIGHEPHQDALQDNARVVHSFQVLLRMLCILHSRIRTKRPSRFLETSVSAIVSACNRLVSNEDAARASLMFIRTISDFPRPSLPPRGSEVPIPSVQRYSAPLDPEADDENAKPEGEEEAKIKLLRILISYVIESYLDPASGRDSASPVHWTERYMQHAHPELLPSYRAEATKALETEDLSVREALITQILDMATVELQMSWSSLKSALCDGELISENDPTEVTIKMSKPGGLYLLTSLKNRSKKMRKAQTEFSMSFEDHDRVATAILGDPQVSLDTNVPSAVVDALVQLGWFMVDEQGFNFDSKPEKDERFNMYLQKFSALAATQVSPGLRYHVYLFTDHVLKAHPSSHARWSFLQDTYRYCPFISLKEVAVLWVKDEYVQVSKLIDQGKDVSTNVFAQAETLRQIIFDVTDMDDTDLSPDMLSAKGPFFQACLSLVYLVCSSATIRKQLGVAKTMRKLSVSNYVDQIGAAIVEAIASATLDGADSEDTMQLSVFQLNTDMAREALARVEETD